MIVITMKFLHHTKGIEKSSLDLPFTKYEAIFYKVL
jgi:hypothetical protein